jgi:hypothetical protein
MAVTMTMKKTLSVALMAVFLALTEAFTAQRPLINQHRRGGAVKPLHATTPAPAFVIY